MDKKTTKWIKGKFFEIIGVILTILAIIIGLGVALWGDAMIALAHCASGDVSCVLIRYVVAVVGITLGGFLVILFMAALWDGLKIILPKIGNYLSVPKSSNIKLGWDRVGDEYFVKVSNQEWSFPFCRFEYCCAVSFDWELRKLINRQLNTSEFIEIKKRKSSDFYFMKVFTENNSFRLFTEGLNLEQIDYGVNTWYFGIRVNFRIVNWRGKLIYDNLLSPKDFEAKVIYKGSNDFQMEIHDAKENVK